MKTKKQQIKKRLGIASIPAINQYLAQAQFEKINIVEVLSQVHIDTAILTDNSRHITGVQFQQLITKLLEHSDNPLFGLHSSRFVRPDSYSILGFISINCATFGEAINKIQPFEQLVGDMGVTSISFDATTTQIQWQCQYTHPPVIQQMVDNCLSSWLAFTRNMIGPDYSPQKVLLQRQSPSLWAQQQYQSIFNCPVLFNQTVDALIIDSALLAVPLTQADAKKKRTLETQAQLQVDKLNQLHSISEQVEMLIGAQLSSGLPKLAVIANQLGMTEKTLQRRLKSQNCRYVTLLNKVRLAQVNDLLALKGLSIVQISELCGFTEPRSFYRWFKQMTGHSPRNKTIC